MNIQKILVTGGTGFLGATLVRRLHSLGHIVKVLDNGFRSSINNLKDIENNIDFIKSDIRDKDKVANAIKGVDTVIHLAAINGTEFFYSKPSLVLDVGVNGILNVLNGCIQENTKNLIIASSSEVYQTPTLVPTSEEESLKVPDPLNPRYSYGGSKIITELLALNYGRSSLNRVIIFRPHNVYGPAMGHEHVLPQFILRIMKQIKKHPAGPLPFDIQGDGKQTRAFIHIDDMVEGILLLLEKGEHLNIYHIGNPQEITTAALAKKVAHYFHRDIQLLFTPLPLGSTERRCPNINKIKSLGFSPKISLDEGLPQTIAWYETQQKKIND